MVDYRPRCPQCSKTQTEVVLIHNPETYDRNAEATLRCGDCGVEWVGLVISPNTQRAKEKGWIQ